MKNVLELDFIHESIHKIIKIQYYAKMPASLYQINILVNLVEINHNIEI